MTPAEQQIYYEGYTKDSLYRDLHLVKLDTLPGVRYRYNIGGMLLIGLALEKVYGQPLDLIVRNYYGGELAMNNTKLISDAVDLPHFAKGYNDKGELMPSLAGMTASLYTMKTTTRDMLKFLSDNIEESRPEIKLSHTPLWGNPQSQSLGFFWQVADDFGLGRWIKHTGYDYGSITMCSLHPDEKTGVMIWASDDSRQNNLFDLERNIHESIRALKK
jgi:CubicO group peptidase (beta-lactamase class C family)